MFTRRKYFHDNYKFKSVLIIYKTNYDDDLRKNIKKNIKIFTELIKVAERNIKLTENKDPRGDVNETFRKEIVNDINNLQRKKKG